MVKTSKEIELIKGVQKWRHLAKLNDIDGKIQICRELLSLVNRNINEELWAAVNLDLGISLYSDSSEFGHENLEESIKHLILSLDFFNQTAHPKVWATIENYLGDAYMKRSGGDKAENIEEAIRHFKLTLQVRTREVFPEMWAEIENELGDAYASRIRGNKAENIEESIRHFEHAIQVITHGAFPEMWAAIEGKLGNAHRNRIKGDKAENIEEAIRHYKLAQQVFTHETSPEMWALIESTLGLIYDNRIKGDKAENIEEAIRHYKLSLKDTTQLPLKNRAMAEVMLGNAYMNRSRSDRAENIEEAIRHYERALQMITREASPHGWAEIEKNLAIAYGDREKGNKVENIEEAIRHNELALVVITRETSPNEWAAIEQNLGNSYGNRIKGEKADNLEKAICHYERALQVRNREASPNEWAETENTLGVVYNERIKGDKAENIEESIRHYELSLQVLTREAFPEDWATIQNNLGNTYVDRIKGERLENIEEAIQHLKFALDVITREASPDQWAEAQNNLGIAYASRIKGNKAENIEKSIHHYECALQVITRDASPEKWATIQNNMRANYGNRIKGDKAENIEESIRNYDLALHMITRESSPNEWASIQANLGAAYEERIRGYWVKNLEEAIRHHKLAQEVYTREAFPQKWASIENNLGNIYLNHIRGGKAQNIKEAIRHYKLALEVITPIELPYYYITTRRSLAKTYFHAKKWEDALTEYQQTIETGVTLFTTAYTEMGRLVEAGLMADVFAEAAYSLIQLGRMDEALLMLEQGKTRVMNEILIMQILVGSKAVGVEGEHFQEIWRNIQDLEAEIRSIPEGMMSEKRTMAIKKLREARRKFQIKVEKIRQAHPEFFQSDLDLITILGLIPDGGAMIVPLITSMGTSVFILPHGISSINERHIINIEKFNTDTLNALFNGTYKDLGWADAYNNWKKLLKERKNNANQYWYNYIEKFTDRLWNELMGMIYEGLDNLQLSKEAPIVILPQGYLRLFPLHAARGSVDGRKCAFLDKYTISYGPSAFALWYCRDLLNAYRNYDPTLLVVDALPEFRQSAEECNNIANQFPNEKVMKLDGNNVTKANIFSTTENKDYIHFSCHGIYRWDDVMESNLELFQKERLTLTDILSFLKLRNNRLISLSACESGFIDVGSLLEEFVGFPGAFMQAGSPCVISSLWAVDVDATNLLMTQFYRFQRESGLSPPLALRKAQISLRDSIQAQKDDSDTTKGLLGVLSQFVPKKPKDRPFENPFFWAAFTAYGF